MALDDRMSIDESDRHDALLLRDGRFDEVVARHLAALRTRARIRLSRDLGAADEALAQCMLRACAEHRRGRTYDVPIRVVLHQMLGWAIAEVLRAAAAQREAVVPDDRVGAHQMTGAAMDMAAGVVARVDLGAALAALAPRDRQCVTLAMAGWTPAQTAEHLGIQANAVHQALSRARARLRRDWLDAD